MADATCKTCPFFRHGGDDSAAGECRRNAPPSVASLDHDEVGAGFWPGVLDHDWCGEHPLRHRDRLAAMAMQGAHAMLPPGDVWSPTGIAQFAYDVADAMLAERARRDSPTPQPEGA